ncbi:MAG: molybdopterin-synthase adenylyltransferase MoeB [Nitrosomonas sp.]|nr:molybdopterin-synthase adenylyltransferase MoeB [Nitrosomonas sp.]
MNDDQLLRYSRHILLPQIDINGQEKLSKSCVLIVGLGGLGCPAALYLAASGINKLIICDPDLVDLTNLQRQILHTTQSVGEAKTSSAERTLYQINPTIEIISLKKRITEDVLQEYISQVDAIIDASDNFITRNLISQMCYHHKKPLISGAVTGFNGQITVFDHRKQENPCYQCLFPELNTDSDVNCAVMGVFAPLAGVIGSIQAAETIKVLLDIGTTLSGRLLLLDGLTMQLRTIKINKDPDCHVCGAVAV